MIVGIGLDLVELRRIEAALARFGARFSEKILTGTERAAAPRRNAVAWLAARFAAKEAGVKALGTGFAHGISLHDLEVRNLPSGMPELLFHGAAAERGARIGAARTHLSITHTECSAAAVVILESA